MAKGLIQCAKKDLPKVLRANVKRREKVEAWYHLTPTSAIPDDRAQHAAAAGYGHPLLPGMVPDAVHRHPAIPGIYFFDLQLLPGVAKRTVPGKWYRTFLFLPALMALGIGLTSPTAKRCWKRWSAIKAHLPALQNIASSASRTKA